MKFLSDCPDGTRNKFLAPMYDFFRRQSLNRSQTAFISPIKGFMCIINLNWFVRRNGRVLQFVTSNFHPLMSAMWRHKKNPHSLFLQQLRIFLALFLVLYFAAFRLKDAVTIFARKGRSSLRYFDCVCGRTAIFVIFTFIVLMTVDP